MNDRRSFLRHTVITATGLLVLPPFSFGESETGESADSLAAGFLHPPTAAKPQAYWMWMNGHITRKGITLDLQAMKQMGLAGAFVYNTGTGIPKGSVTYGSNKWEDLLQHALTEAKRLGLQLAMHNSPGFSSTGGKLVSPAMSMQQLVWSETTIAANETSNPQLPQPFTKLGYYKDAIVVAFPSLAAETVSMQESLKQVSLNGNEIDKDHLYASSENGFLDLSPSGGQSATLQLEFDKPFAARSLTLIRAASFSQASFDAEYNRPISVQLDCSDDGRNFRSVCTVAVPRLRYMDLPVARNFPLVRARYFRLSSTHPLRLARVELHGAERLNDWPGKLNFAEHKAVENLQVTEPSSVVDPETVIDLTGQLQPDGRLRWSPPKGTNRWTILRIGHTCTGTTTVSSPDGATGLEIDKFSKEAVDEYFQLYFHGLLRPLQKFIPQTFTGLFIDSWEVGRQNWTAGFPEAFATHCGYALTAWAPALTGRIVKSARDTEKVLWDLRQTQAKLVAENYYGQFRKRCKVYGLRLSAQPNGDGMFDGLQAGGQVDEALAEFWVRNLPGTLNLCKQAASIAHGYGRRIVAAEAYTGLPQTSRWTEYPYALKAQGDYLYTLGINRFVLHVFVHQPYSGQPGMTMGPYGTHFDRHSTWAKQASAWVRYLARTQYLLQQGLPVVDVCYFKGEEPASGIPDVNYVNPPVPKSLAGDVIGSDVLLNRLQVKNGVIILPDGMTYRLLILAPLEAISLPILQKLLQLVRAGMTLLVTAKPTGLPGRGEEKEAQAVIDELWGDLDGEGRKERSLGNGTVYWNKPFADVLQTLRIDPDCEWESQNSDAAIHFTHRRLGDADIYFISNHLRRREFVRCLFRVTGKRPEIWDPQAGEMTFAACYAFEGERTVVPLELEPAGSLFVLFRQKRKEASPTELLFNGVPLLSASPFPPKNEAGLAETANNFTLLLWVKPDTPSEHPKGILLFPSEGEAVYGKGHAACGLAAGQNGVRVYERAKGPNRDALLVLEAVMPLQGWTHLAIRYANGKPSLFVNSRLVAEAKASGKRVHPVLGTPPTDEAFSAYFEGDQTPVLLVNRVMGEEEIAAQYNQGLPPPELPGPAVLQQTRDEDLHLKIWQNGRYEIRRKGSGKVIEATDCRVERLNASWKVRFPAASGISTITLPKLVSLHRHPDFAVRHFSGTATYQTVFFFEKKAWTAQHRARLHLGRMENIAEVTLNGKALGLLWKEPFCVDVTAFLRNGKNRLEVRVTNLWPNRLIGDAHFPDEVERDADGIARRFPSWYLKNQFPVGPRKTFAAWNTFKKTDPLLEAGLLGPVHLLVGLEEVVAGRV